MLQEEGVDHEAGHASQGASNGAPVYERTDSFEPPDAARYIILACVLSCQHE